MIHFWDLAINKALVKIKKNRHDLCLLIEDELKKHNLTLSIDALIYFSKAYPWDLVLK